ncbi:MAG: hypothetical protein JSS27_20660 [Planctomycetes bacterium]|nr:hypothetical protein [Planctomycetota bacterium]
MSASSWIRRLGLLICCAIAAGCVRGPYQYSQFHASNQKPAPSDIHIVHGQPRPKLDRVAKIAATPQRVLHLNRKVNRHELSPETQAVLVAYMCQNDLADVQVHINCYEPSEQWRLLRENDRIGPGWRYTLGSLSVIGYTVLPGRVFGGDRYNPFTNTLNLNSDVPAVVLREAAYAKDVHGRKLPGTYVAINQLPFVGLWHDTRSVSDVLAYAEAHEDWELEKEAYHVLFPRVGADVANSGAIVAPVWWEGAAIGVGGSLVGHATGRTVAARRSMLRARRSKALESMLAEARESREPSEPSEVIAADATDSLEEGTLSLAPAPPRVLFESPR